MSSIEAEVIIILCNDEVDTDRVSDIALLALLLHCRAWYDCLVSCVALGIASRHDLAYTIFYFALQEGTRALKQASRMCFGI